jgi:iron complex outermembrane receptor protein
VRTAPNSPSELQEVVVTAQRSVSGLQTTPLAVTALSGAALKALNVTDLDSLALAVPGVIGDELGEAHIAIRGIGSEAVNYFASCSTVHDFSVSP